MRSQSLLTYLYFRQISPVFDLKWGRGICDPNNSRTRCRIIYVIRKGIIKLNIIHFHGRWGSRNIQETPRPPMKLKKINLLKKMYVYLCVHLWTAPSHDKRQDVCMLCMICWAIVVVRDVLHVNLATNNSDWTGRTFGGKSSVFLVR